MAAAAAAPGSSYTRPALPFAAPICGGLRDGLTVLLSGSALPSCRRFQVNFQCGLGQVPKTEVAFHFNPRFDEGCVVWNSFERGRWQREGRSYEMPFQKGHAFEVRFLVTRSSFLVAVNGKQLLEFSHRIPASRVDTLSVTGDLQVASITFYAPPAPDIWGAAAATMTSAAFQANPLFPPGQAWQSAAFPPGPGPCFLPQAYAMPYRTPICGGLFPSKSVVLAGRVLPAATRFHVNLKAGDDIAFHLNPRFSENAMVRNSKVGGAWGPEERQLPAGMPLSRNQPFSIQIQCEPQGFKVAVNGQHLLSYNHRVSNLHEIDLLEVEGDVALSSVQA